MRTIDLPSERYAAEAVHNATTTGHRAFVAGDEQIEGLLSREWPLQWQVDLTFDPDESTPDASDAERFPRW